MRASADGCIEANQIIFLASMFPSSADNRVLPTKPMTTNHKQSSDGREDRIRSGLKWIGSQVRDVRFGTIRGVLIRDGALIKGPRFRVTRTGKPRGRGSSGNHDAMEADDVLRDALRDLRLDTASRSGEWEIKFKVHKGIPVSWKMAESGRSTVSDTN